MTSVLRPLHEGNAVGRVVLLQEPLSFWGGTDLSGSISDRNHPQFGLNLAGAILLMTASRGSSSSTSVLAEQLRLGTAPAGFVLASADPIVALAAIVAAELYGTLLPIAEMSDLSQLSRVVAAGRARLVVSARAATITPSDPY